MCENNNTKQEKLWTMNFFLLWQGQLVSAFGDIIYELALGFWILAATGSTALMGTLMATSMLPRIIISPFAGVWVDRLDRKKLIVWMDVIRGVFITLVALAAIFNVIQIWMVFAAGIIMGICAAFFNPSVTSVIPDIVPGSRLMQANSYFSMIQAGTSLAGSPVGGILFQILGAPFMFLINGISYLFSAFTEIFIKVPKIEKKEEQLHYWADLKEGYKFVWGFSGLRNLIAIAAILNFFANAGMVLILPLFYNTESLGAGKYGIAMALLTGGMLAGMVFTSAVKIKYELRMLVFSFSGIISTLCFAGFPLTNNYYLMLVLLFAAGMLNAILNVLFQVSTQLTVPQNMRGKVFSLIGMVTMSLSPVAMALGGIIGELLPLRTAISGSFFITALLFVPFIFLPSFRRFINFDPDKQKLEDILTN